MGKKATQILTGLIWLALIGLYACQAKKAPTSTETAPQAEPATATPAQAPAATATQPSPTKSIVLPELPTVPPEPTYAPLSPGVQVEWEFQTEGPVWSIPTVSEGVVYFGSDDQHLYAIDLQTHQLLWKFATQGIIRSQPAVHNGLVYITSDDGALYAVFTHTGQQAWQRDIGNFTAREQRETMGNSPDPNGYDYVQSSPVVSGGLVYAGSMDGSVYAVNAASGEIVWTYATKDRVRATPAVAEGVVYVGSWDGSLYALDATSGEFIWQSPLFGKIQSRALVVDGLVYCASRKASVFAIDAASGEGVWEYMYGSNMWVESSPVYHQGIVYVGSSGSQWVVGLEASTGKSHTKFMSRSFNWSIPAITEDNVLVIGGTNVPGLKNGLFVLDLVDGKFTDISREQGLFMIADSLEASGGWYGVASSPVLADGMIYFGGLDGKLYAASLLKGD